MHNQSNICHRSLADFCPPDQALSTRWWQQSAEIHLLPLEAWLDAITPSRPHTLKNTPHRSDATCQGYTQPDLLWTAAYRHTNTSPLIVLHPEHVQAGDLKVIVNVRPCWIIDHRGDSRPDKIITTERLAAQPLPVTAEVMTLIAPHVDQFRPADVVYWLTGTLDVINRCFKFQQRQRCGWNLWLDYHHDQQHRITDMEMWFIND